MSIIDVLARLSDTLPEHVYAHLWSRHFQSLAEHLSPHQDASIALPVAPFHKRNQWSWTWRRHCDAVLLCNVPCRKANLDSCIDEWCPNKTFVRKLRASNGLRSAGCRPAHPLWPWIWSAEEKALHWTSNFTRFNKDYDGHWKPSQIWEETTSACLEHH